MSCFVFFLTVYFGQSRTEDYALTVEMISLSDRHHESQRVSKWMSGLDDRLYGFIHPVLPNLMKQPLNGSALSRFGFLTNFFQRKDMMPVEAD